VDAVPAPGTGDPTPVLAPQLDEGPHLSYAVQWFIFATCVVVGWVLAVRRAILTRKAPDPAAAGRGPGRPGANRDAGNTTDTDGPATTADTTEGSAGAALTAGADPSAGADPRPSGGDAATTAPTGTTGSSPH